MESFYTISNSQSKKVSRGGSRSVSPSKKNKINLNTNSNSKFLQSSQYYNTSNQINSQKSDWNNDVKLQEKPQIRKFPFVSKDFIKIDNQGKQFQILPFILQEELIDFLNNKDQIQNKQHKKYQEIVKIANKIGINSLQEMIDNDDILLEALRAPPGWYKIQYLKSKKKYYWNELTDEISKQNQSLNFLKQQVIERKNNQCYILAEITIEDVQNFYQGYSKNTLIKDIEKQREFQNDYDINIIKHDKFSIIKSTCIEIGMETVKQFDKQVFMDILMKALNLEKGWTRVYFINLKQMGFYNPLIQERQHINPFIIKYKKDFQNAKIQNNYVILKEINNLDIQNYLVQQLENQQHQQQQINNTNDLNNYNNNFKTEDIEKHISYFGMKTLYEQILFKQFLEISFSQHDSWKKVKFDETEKICYLNIKNKLNQEKHPLLKTLIPKFKEKRDQNYLNLQKIKNQGLQEIFNNQFSTSYMHGCYKLQNNQTVQVTSSDNYKLKVAMLEDAVSNIQFRKYKVDIIKLKEIMGIGLFNFEVMDYEAFVLNNKTPQEGTYLIMSEGNEFIYTTTVKTEGDYQKQKNSLNNQKKFYYKQGDSIIISIDIYKQRITYYNENTDITFTQAIRKSEQNLRLGVTMQNYKDEIKIQPLYDFIEFPFQLDLVTDQNVYNLDLEVKCLCQNLINHENQQCLQCQFYYNELKIEEYQVIQIFFKLDSDKIQNFELNYQVSISKNKQQEQKIIEKQQKIMEQSEIQNLETSVNDMQQQSDISYDNPVQYIISLQKLQINSEDNCKINKQVLNQNLCCFIDNNNYQQFKYNIII